MLGEARKKTAKVYEGRIPYNRPASEGALQIRQLSFRALFLVCYSLRYTRHIVHS